MRWSHFSSNTIRLKAINSSSYIIHIITPSSYSWISSNFFTRYTCCGKRFFKSCPSFSVRYFFSICSNSSTFTYKWIFSFTYWISAVGSINNRPKIFLTFRTLISAKIKFSKSIYRIIFFKVCLKFFSNFIFNFLCSNSYDCLYFFDLIIAFFRRIHCIKSSKVYKSKVIFDFF